MSANVLRAASAAFLSIALVVIGLLVHHGGYRHKIEFSGGQGCADSTSLYLRPDHDASKNRRITYCSNGDRDTLVIRSEWFSAAGRYINFEYSGYPGVDGVGVYYEDSKGKQFPVTVDTAREQWKEDTILVDGDAKDPVRLVLGDNHIGYRGWIGVGDVYVVQSLISWRGLAKLLAVLVTLYFVSLGIYSIAYRAGVIMRFNQMYVSFAFLLLVGCLGFAFFWFYYFHVAVARASSVVATTGLSIYPIYVFFKNREAMALAHKAILPVFLLTALYLAVGFFPFVDADWQHQAATRWRNLPPDNWIPKIFADQILAQSVKSPMLGDWLASDRPPLLTGIFLFLGAGSSNDLVYQVIATWTQVLVLLPLYYLVKKLSLSCQFSVMSLVCISFSSLMFFHSVFVWPKLIAAAYVAIFFILLFEQWQGKVHGGWQGGMLAASAALAMLSHGGSAFALLILACGLLLLRQNLNIKMLGSFLGVAIALYLPWFLFQKLAFPPGDRLIKWHLAGVFAPTDASFFQVLYDAYTNIDFTTWLESRQRNLEIIFFRGLSFVRDLFNCNGLQLVRETSFFCTSYSMWFFTPLLIPVWLLISRKRLCVTGSFQWLTYLSVASGIYVGWALLMFRGGSTLIHQGSFFPWLLLIIVACYSVYMVNIYLFSILVFVNLVLAFLVFVPFKEQFLIADYLIFYSLLLVLFACYVRSWIVYSNCRIKMPAERQEC